MSRTKKFAGYQGHGHFDSKRRLILEEAARRFAVKGVHAASLEDIAGAFKISRAALYNYFKSKDEMIEEIIRGAGEGMEELLLDLEAADMPGLEKLRTYALRYSEVVFNDSGRFLTLVQPATLSPRCRKLFVETNRRRLQGVRRLIAAGIADGSIAPCDPTVATFATLGALNSVSGFFDRRGPLSQDQIAHMIVGMFVDGLSTGPRPDGRRGAGISARKSRS